MSCSSLCYQVVGVAGSTRKPTAGGALLCRDVANGTWSILCLGCGWRAAAELGMGQGAVYPPATGSAVPLELILKGQ